MILSDCHGPMHGSRVEVGSGEVHIWEWAESCEPDDTGARLAEIRHTTMTLRECLEHATVAAAAYRAPFNAYKSQADRVHAGAVHYIANNEPDRDNEITDVSGSRPCDHFGQYWGLRGDAGKSAAPRRDLDCGRCGVGAAFDAGDAAAWGPRS